MIALDTNVLVRYLAQDDARQSAAASRLIEQTLNAANRGFISLVALLETVWVMESRYDADPSNVAAILADLLDARRSSARHRLNSSRCQGANGSCGTRFSGQSCHLEK